MKEEKQTCSKCGKYPFCEFTTCASQEACCQFIKRETKENIKKEGK